MKSILEIVVLNEVKLTDFFYIFEIKKRWFFFIYLRPYGVYIYKIYYKLIKGILVKISAKKNNLKKSYKKKKQIFKKSHWY